MEERLIELVKLRPVLWNNKEKGYKHHFLKEKAWTEIGKELGIAAEKAKKRFKSLRDYYRIQRSASKQKFGGGTSDELCVMWKYYNLMQFLDDGQNAVEENTSPVMDESDNISEINFEYSSEAPKHSKPSNEHAAPKRRLQRKKEEDYLKSCFRSLKEMSDRNIRREIDEFDAIGISWAAKMRKLDECQKVLAEDIINQVMRKAFFNELTMSTRLVDEPDKNSLDLESS